MISNEELHEKVSKDSLMKYLLDIHGEADSLDFKQELSINTARDKAELARDVLAFANTEGGGHIIFGVEDKTYALVGLVSSPPVDTTSIYRAIGNYITALIRLMAAEYLVKLPTKTQEMRFGILYVAKYPGIVVPRCDLAYEYVEEGTDKRRTKILAHQGDILVRRGAQTCKADQSFYDRLLSAGIPAEGKKSGDPSSPDDAEEPMSPLAGNLPTREEVVTNFVGRNQELNALQSWFEDPYSRRWLLAGDGGKGKTAIAYEFATHIQMHPSKNLEYVLWLSAKRRRFSDGTIKLMEGPDFWDLPSLLDAIAKGYGFTDYLTLPPYEKREKVIELLTLLPALLVADDVDSLEPQHEDAIEFLISDLASTPSKVLLTSRRVPFGLNAAKTQVTGFDPNQEEGRLFIHSRLRLFGLDQALFPKEIIREILEVTDGSPLYAEDLLRLCKVLPVHEAIASWKGKLGLEARKYALGRELVQ